MDASAELRDAALARLVRLATVRIGGGVGESAFGTGFLVAPRTVVTCAHVLAKDPSGLAPTVTGRFTELGVDVVLEASLDWYHRDEDKGQDIAFLRTNVDIDVRPVLTAPGGAPGDPVLIYGHPEGDFREGRSVLTTLQGPSRRPEIDVRDRVGGGRLTKGYSGSAALNLRTGAVCGVVCWSDKRDSAHFIPVAEMLDLDKDVKPVQHKIDGFVPWLDELSDEQTRRGPWRYPGPTLRRYLKAAVTAAEELPYADIGGVSPPPLSTVYVSQRAAPRSSAATEPADATNSRIEAAKIFDWTEHCVVIGAAGAGKSSLLQYGLFTLAGRWRSGERPSVMPVRITAADLAKHEQLGPAIAKGIEPLLADGGAPLPLSAEVFAEQPLAGTRWLVLVDGLDEVGDTVVRRKIVRRLRLHPAECYRFVIATRDLPDVELPSGGDWLPAPYELQPLEADQLPAFATTWFRQLGVPTRSRRRPRSGVRSSASMSLSSPGCRSWPPCCAGCSRRTRPSSRQAGRRSTKSSSGGCSVGCATNWWRPWGTRCRRPSPMAWPTKPPR